MLSLYPLVLAFNAVYLVMHQSFKIFLLIALVQLVLFGLLNFIAAWLLYRPIDRFFRRGEETEQTKERINWLTWYSTAWVFLLGGVYVLLSLSAMFLFPPEVEDFSLGELAPVLLLTFFPSLLFVYAILPAFITYFLVNDFCLGLKAEAFEQSRIQFAVGNKKIGITLLFVFLILGLLPSLLVILDLVAVSSLEEEFAQFMSLNPLGTVLVDRFVVLVGMIFAIIFITRSFTRPIYSLMSAINKVRQGNFSTQAAIVTEDEIGVLTKAFNEMVDGLKERELIRDTFGKYVTKDVADVILSQKLNLEGETRECTILVTDIANYTTISESLSPEEVVRMLNEYFSVLVEIIQRHKGVVNKFIGDAVFAMFNVPLDDPDHAVNAIKAALEIEQITKSRTFGNGSLLTTRIGINSGSVVAGNIGSADRLEYTLIGDEVNIASRLEQLNKQYGTNILLGENTYDMAKAHFEFTQLGEFQLKGKKKTVKVYKPG